MKLEVFYKKVVHIYWIAISLLGCSEVIASGFQVQEQNVSNMGNSYAGVAVIEDASAAFYNPAALINIAEKQVTLPLSVIIPNIKFTATQAFAGNDHGSPIDLLNGSTAQDNPAKPVFIPALHYGARVTENVVFGLSAAVPFGADLQYSETGIARYLATKTSITTGLVSPSIAYKVSPRLSLAAGFDVAKSTAKFANQMAAASTPSITTDGYYKFWASGTSYGYHLGLLYKINDSFKFGMSYRSSFNVDANGKRYQVTTLGAEEEIAQINAKITLPNTFNVSLSVPILVKQIALLLDYQRTNWSTIQNLTVLNKEGIEEQGGGISAVTPLFFKNTDRWSFGVNVSPTENVTFKVGMATDEAPTSSLYRIPRLPDSNRTWISTGFHYSFSKDVSMDLGMAKITFLPASLDAKAPLINGEDGKYTSKATLTGSYDSSAFIFGMQINYNFTD